MLECFCKDVLSHIYGSIVQELIKQFKCYCRDVQLHVSETLEGRRVHFVAVLCLLQTGGLSSYNQNGFG